MSKPFDLVAIGDTATDAFIRLKEAHVNCRIDTKACEICMSFGDKIPYESATIIAGVGNSANAAVSGARLGLSTALVSDIGNDLYGKEVLASLSGNRVATDFVRTHEKKTTNYHYVLWYGAERTILVKHEEYLYALPDIGEPRWVYLSSLGANSVSYHRDILKYLLDHPRIKLAFQPGTFQIKIGPSELKLLYKRTDIFFSNLEEAQTITGIKAKDVGLLLKGMAELGPKIVVLTDGPRGAYAYENGSMRSMPAYPDPKPPLERTGAGDAFSSSVVAALAQGKTLQEGFEWGMINAMSVTQHIGAQEGLLTQADISALLSKAPSNFKFQKLV
ncbi:carbohydrate kinase family protein [Candidatus Parcubacteria bacterium]|nr:carbohydrate kinase family protein [Candidatus Parcubacteria bacterium]